MCSYFLKDTGGCSERKLDCENAAVVPRAAMCEGVGLPGVRMAHEVIIHHIPMANDAFRRTSISNIEPFRKLQFDHPTNWHNSSCLQA